MQSFVDMKNINFISGPLGVLIILCSILGAIAAGWFLLAVGAWEIIEAVRTDTLTFWGLVKAVVLIGIRSAVSFAFALCGFALGTFFLGRPFSS